jgi:hypothetical protein
VLLPTPPHQQQHPYQPYPPPHQQQLQLQRHHYHHHLLQEDGTDPGGSQWSVLFFSGVNAALQRKNDFYTSKHKSCV